MTGNSSKYSIFLCSNKYTNKPFKFLATKLSLFIPRPISQYFVKVIIIILSVIFLTVKIPISIYLSFYLNFIDLLFSLVNPHMIF